MSKLEKRGRPKSEPVDETKPPIDMSDSVDVNRRIKERVENWDHEKWRSKTKG
jgi:hypothetical protein